MRTYLLKRLLLFIPTAFGVSIVIFVMLHTIPGDYATALFVGGEGTSIVTQEGKMIPGYLPPEELLNLLNTNS